MHIVDLYLPIYILQILFLLLKSIIINETYVN